MHRNFSDMRQPLESKKQKKRSQSVWRNVRSNGKLPVHASIPSSNKLSNYSKAIICMTPQTRSKSVFPSHKVGELNKSVV